MTIYEAIFRIIYGTILIGGAIYIIMYLNLFINVLYYITESDDFKKWKKKKKG